MLFEFDEIGTLIVNESRSIAAEYGNDFVGVEHVALAVVRLKPEWFCVRPWEVQELENELKEVHLHKTNFTVSPERIPWTPRLYTILSGFPAFLKIAGFDLFRAVERGGSPVSMLIRRYMQGAT